MDYEDLHTRILPVLLAGAFLGFLAGSMVLKQCPSCEKQTYENDTLSNQEVRRGIDEAYIQFLKSKYDDPELDRRICDSLCNSNYPGSYCDGDCGCHQEICDTFKKNTSTIWVHVCSNLNWTIWETEHGIWGDKIVGGLDLADIRIFDNFFNSSDAKVTEGWREWENSYETYDGTEYKRVKALSKCYDGYISEGLKDRFEHWKIYEIVDSDRIIRACEIFVNGELRGC